MVMADPSTWPAQLTRYVAERMQCEPELPARAGVHLIAARRPRLRVWQHVLPVWAMVFQESAIVSVAPDLTARMQRIMRGATVENLLDDERVERVRAMAANWGPVDWMGRGLWLHCAPETFTPRFAAEVVWVPPEHPEGRTLRERHRGEVFGVFRAGELISRSSLKTESDEAWEIAVTTGEAYRRQGLGASVVSRATEFIFEQGKTALYNCDATNAPSRALAESLGYRLFARDLMWSVEARWGAWFWEEQG